MIEWLETGSREAAAHPTAFWFGALVGVAALAVVRCFIFGRCT